MDYSEHINEKIQANEKRVSELKGLVAELMATAEAEERDLDESETEQLNTLAQDIESTEKTISSQRMAHKALAERVIEKQAPTIIHQRGHVERSPGELHIKHATAQYIAHLEKKPLDVVVKERYPNDQGLQAVVRSTQDPADTTTAGWAAELTEEANQGYLELLRGASVAAQMWPSAGVNLNFMGYTALNVPKRAGTTTDLASGFTGELAAIPVRSATFESQRIEPYKWGAIVTMSKEVVARSTPAIQSIVQSGMVADTATKLDADYYGSEAAVAGYRPAGLFNGVAGVPASTGGATPADDMLADLRNLLDPIYSANMGQMVYIAIHPSNALSMSTILYNGNYLFRDELARGQLAGHPVIVSTNVPTDEIWAVDMAQQAVASGAMEFTTSDTATIVEMDDDGVAPYMGANQPRNPSGQVGDAARDDVNTPSIRSLFQTETVALKLVQYISWANLRTGSVNKITGVAY